MLKLKKGQKPDVDYYLVCLRKYGKVHYRLSDLEVALLEYKTKLNDYKQYLNRYLANATLNYCSSVDTRNDVLNYLRHVLLVPPHRITDPKKKTLSVAAPLLEGLIGLGYDDFFLQNYINMNSYKSRKSTMEGFIDDGKDNGEVDRNGEKLVDISFTIGLEDSLRTYYSSRNVQAFPKSRMKAFTVKDGYTMIKGDFEQSDLKIVICMLLLDKTNINTFVKYRDSYEALARIVEGPDFRLERFVEERKDYKAYALGAVYGKQSGITYRQKEIVQKISAYANSCPSYREYKRRIIDQMKYGFDVLLYSYFGGENSASKAFKPKEHEMLNYCLNLVPQRGTSEVVIHTSNSICRALEDKGYSMDNGDFYYYLNRHDEPIYMVKNEILNEVAPVFQDHETIMIDGWIPLRIKFNACYDYTDKLDCEVNNKFHSYYDNIPEPKDSDVVLDVMSKYERYIPTKDVFEITVVTEENKDDTTSIVFFPSNQNRMTPIISKIATTDKGRILNYIFSKVNQSIDSCNLEDSIVIVNTTLVDVAMSYMNKTIVKVTKDFNNIKYSTALNALKSRDKRNE